MKYIRTKESIIKTNLIKSKKLKNMNLIRLFSKFKKIKNNQIKNNNNQ